VASPLDNLCGPGKALRKEAPDANEFAGLKRSGLDRYLIGVTRTSTSPCASTY